MANGDSNAAVAAGEKLTEREALEALLLPSANNIAMMLANWDAGSRTAFVAKMNARAKALGMKDTTYTDPSGLDAGTVSTARDQLILVRKAMAIPAFAGIVAMPSAVIPVAGTIRNYRPCRGDERDHRGEDRLGLGRAGVLGVRDRGASSPGRSASCTAWCSAPRCCRPAR